ncbi:hypothetical protein PENSTE_c020G06636 [Penicillium steckii]|uniref:asparaginase n=1 Tax=Penicillium steckii TaxID=303698 RepID=A0A1V6SU95_9EURO|nr:hypothetical protein PENSTE_c020G06636 [Penicillium steckii]
MFKSIASILFLAQVHLTISTPVSHTISSPCKRASHGNENLPNITIYGTGGTIASKAGTNTQTTNYKVGVTIDSLVEAVPELCDISNVSGLQVSNVDSGSINSTILLDLARRINNDMMSPTSYGSVVTHGTDTLEETAFFLELTLKSKKPVIVTGAMRPSTAMSADGPLNLYQAVKLAGSNEAHGRGVLVVLNDRIGSAYTTTKNNANSLDTFYATEQGQLGFFINQTPKFYSTPSTPRNKPHFEIGNAKSLQQVDILYGYQDANPILIEASVQSGAKGIIFAGVGAGGWSEAGLEVAQKLFNETGIPMIFSRRTEDGFAGGDSIYSFQMTSGFLNPCFGKQGLCCNLLF